MSGLTDTQFARAVDLFQQGQIDAAGTLCDRIIAIEPRHANALHVLGIVALHKSDALRAVELIQQSLQIDGQQPFVWCSLGNAFRDLQRAEEALASYQRAIERAPAFAGAHYGAGNACSDLRRWTDALASFDRALSLEPRHAQALLNRGNALLELGRLEEALASYTAAFANQPALTEALLNSAQVLRRLQRPQESLQVLGRLLQLRPGDAEAHNGCGLALQSLRRYDEALASFDAALRIQPDALDVKYRRAVALRGLGRHSEAARGFAEIFESAPAYDYVVGNLLHERLQSCDWTDYELLRAAAEESVLAGARAYVPGPYFTVANSAELEWRCAQTFVADKALNQRTALMPPLPARPQPERTCIAYVSGDFREHPVSQLLAGVLEAHDRGRFRVLGISLQPEQVSPLGQRIKRGFDDFIDASAHDDRSLALLMRELGVDIAVDLMGFSGGSRPGLFALRPAPVQVTYLGFAGTMGTVFHDYIIADRYTIPADDRKFYTEQVVWLPDCFQPNDDQRAVPLQTETRAQHGLPATGFVFCCFNTPYKISPPLFAVWMRLLAAVEHSVLWLPDGGEELAANLRSAATQAGIDAGRLIFAPRLPDFERHLARYRLADLFLDTLPYNAHTTASDALWAGLPVLTCQGRSFAARVASSLLHAVGLDELITEDLEQYESVGRNLALDPGALARLRASLAATRVGNPLFNTRRYVRNLEHAYQRMAELHYAGLDPRAIEVPPRD